MSRRKRYAFWIEQEQLEGLHEIRARDGVLPSEQIRRALDEWLKKRGVRKVPRPRATTPERG